MIISRRAANRASAVACLLTISLAAYRKTPRHSVDLPANAWRTDVAFERSAGRF